MRYWDRSSVLARQNEIVIAGWAESGGSSREFSGEPSSLIRLCPVD
jgi:hypothetical protein